MEESTDFMRGWLRGFFDGEGSVTFKRIRARKGGYSYTTHRKRASACNTDPALIDTCLRYLRVLGIKPTTYVRTRNGHHSWKPAYKPLHIIYVMKNNDLRRFAEMVGFTTPMKRERLNDIIRWIDTRPRSKYSLTELRRLYEGGLTQDELAKHCGIKKFNHEHLLKLLRRSGAKVRTASDALRLSHARRKRGRLLPINLL